MRTSLAGILFFLTSFACMAQVQQNLPPQKSQPKQDGGVREVLESIVIPPIPNSPFTATLATEATKYSADGATMTFVNERRIARDQQGRIYEERWLLVPKGGNVKSSMNWIQIADPEQHTLYNCSPQKQVCELKEYDPASDLAAASLHSRSNRSPRSGDGHTSWEQLGTRNILGMDTVGMRETTTISAGTMGNDQPLTSLSEYWHSEQLGLNLLSVRSSPFFGKQTFTVTELTTSEPDPQLFQLPEGFKIDDQRKNPPISQ